MEVAVAQPTEYYHYKSLGKHLLSLVKQDPNLVRVNNIAWSMAKRKVWLVEVGKGPKQDHKARPAILVVAGVEGNDLIGSSLAVSWIEHLIQQYQTDANIFELLQTTTIYIIPRLNPDAAEHFFSQPKFETCVSNKPVDEDHDGFIDEDGPEDLNGDGLISWMRVGDPEGQYILDPVDDRLLLKADHLKNEVGAWRYLTEGIDNDNDELWNEDSQGGVNLNRNFPYNFKFFATDAGLHQVSETETRALAEFVIEHPNIGIVFTYGIADNLLKTPEGAPSDERRKPMTAIDEKDLGYYRTFGDIYKETLGLTKEIDSASMPGTFSDWMYFHRGRLSLAARAWSPKIAVELSKAAEKKEKNESENEEKSNQKKEATKDDEDKRNKDEREQLKWFDKSAPEAFITWRRIEHPDFPDQRVEVGGYAPYALTNPPIEMLEEITTKHVNFLTTIAQRLPRIGIRGIQSHHLGKSIYEIEIQVENTGFLPTSLAHGETTHEVYPTRVIIELDNEFFLSGNRITNLPSIQGSGGMAEVRYIIHAPDHDEIDFKVVSMLAGQVEGTIKLMKDE